MSRNLVVYDEDNDYTASVPVVKKEKEVVQSVPSALPQVSNASKKRKIQDSEPQATSSSNQTLTPKKKAHFASFQHHLHFPQLLPTRPLDLSTKKKDLLHYVNIWEQICLSSPALSLKSPPSSSSVTTQFEQDIHTIIEKHYPFDSKTLLDNVLAAFLLFHPEYTQTFLQPLVNKVLFATTEPTSPSASQQPKAMKRGGYNRKDPPFYAFIGLFNTAGNQDLQTQMDEMREHSVQKEILLYLTKRSVSKQESLHGASTKDVQMADVKKEDG
jgi:hypothetical protein